MKKNKNFSARAKRIIISLILAIAVWITVTYLNNPDITTTISDLGVNFSGEMMLRNKGLVVTEKKLIPPLSVIVSGKRSDLIEYIDKLYVDIDVSNISAAGDYMLSGAISLPTTKITVEEEKYGEIPVKIEEMAEKDIPVEIRQTGTNKKLVKSEALQQSVKISGAKSEIEKVSGGIAEIDISKIEQNEKISVPYLLVDSEQNFIEKNETIETTTAKISVKNTIYERRTLPIKLKLSPEMDEKYILNEDKTTLSDSSVEVGVLSENHDDCVYTLIDSPSDEVREYRLHETDGMYIPESKAIIRIKPDLSPKFSRQLELEVEYRNVPEGKSISGDNKISATVYGREDKLNTDNVKAYVDFTNAADGEGMFPVVIEGETISTEVQYMIKAEVQ